MRLRCAHLSAAVAFLAAVSIGSVAFGSCFSAKDSRDLKFQVFQQAPPPSTDDQKGYRHHPLSAASSMNIGSLNSSRFSGDKYWFQWSNRCQNISTDAAEKCGWNPKGNIVSPRLMFSGEEKRLFFSTLAKANLCTMIQASYALDVPFDEAAAQAVGLRVLNYSDAEGALTDGRFVDACIKPPDRLNADVKGIILDYEVQDGRTPDATLQFLSDYAALVRRSGRKVGLFTNPLDAPTQQYTGFNEMNSGALLREFDLFGIMLWGGNRQNDIKDSYQTQMRMLEKAGKVDASRVMIIFDIARTKVDDARIVHDIMIDQKIPNLMIWRNWATVGEEQCNTEVNRKLTCVIFGRCQ